MASGEVSLTCEVLYMECNYGLEDSRKRVIHLLTMLINFLQHVIVSVFFRSDLFCQCFDSFYCQDLSDVN